MLHQPYFASCQCVSLFPWLFWWKIWEINCVWHKDSIYAELGKRLNILNDKVQLVMWSKQENSRCQNTLRFKTRGNRIKMFCCRTAQRLFDCSFFSVTAVYAAAQIIGSDLHLWFAVSAQSIFSKYVNNLLYVYFSSNARVFSNGEKTEMLTFILGTIKWIEVFRSLSFQTLKSATLFFFLL